MSHVFWTASTPRMCIYSSPWSSSKATCFPFLDVLVRRDAGALSFSVYRKPTHTGRYSSFESCHPLGHKTSVVSSLIKRAVRICSDDSALKRELGTIRRKLSANGYPKRLICLTKYKILQPRMANNRTLRVRAAIPYVLGISEALSRVFSKYDMRIAHVPTSKLRDD